MFLQLLQCLNNVIVLSPPSLTRQVEDGSPAVVKAVLTEKSGQGEGENGSYGGTCSNRTRN